MISYLAMVSFSWQTLGPVPVVSRLMMSISMCLILIRTSRKQIFPTMTSFKWYLSKHKWQQMRRGNHSNCYCYILHAIVNMPCISVTILLGPLEYLFGVFRFRVQVSTTKLRDTFRHLAFGEFEHADTDTVHCVFVFKALLSTNLLYYFLFRHTVKCILKFETS